MSNHQRGFIATNIILLILAGLVLVGGATVGVVKLAQKSVEPQCEGGACPTATSTIAFPESDWAPRAPDVCGDSVCGPDEAANPTLCPSDCEVKEAPTGPAPTITFTAKPASLPAGGGTAVITWASEDATSCASSATPGRDSTWFFAGAPSGIINVSLGSLGKTYTITCVGPGGSSQKSVTIAVAPPEKKKIVIKPTYKAPTITLSPTSAKISYGKTALFSWKTAYATSCTGSGPWSDSVFGTADTKYTSPLLESAIVELTCIGQGGSVTKKAAVTVADAKGCYLGVSKVDNGSSATAYQASAVGYGKSCASETRTCTNGSLSGSYLYPNCTVADASSCVTPWYETVKDGATVTAYQSSSAKYGETCTSETRTCSNGTLSGSYTKSSCEVAEAKDCSSPTLGTVPNGESVEAYQSSSVAYGQTCTSQSRTCSNGTLSGSYTYASCTGGVAKDCSSPMLGTVISGDSVTAYQSSSVAYGQTCTSQSRTCSNGTLSGTYTYSSCTQGAPGAPTITLTPAQSSVAYDGSTTIDWSVGNATSPTCTGTGGWSGQSFTGKSGSKPTGALTISTSFGLNCMGDGDTTASKSISITVGAVPPCAANQTGTYPNCVNKTYYWSTGNWSPASCPTTPGSQASTQTRTVSCKDNATDVTTNDLNCVAATKPGITQNCSAVPNTPTVTFTANLTTVTYRGSTKLSWTTTDATSCTASGAWSGNKNASGSETIGFMSLPSGNYTYTIICVGPSGSTAQESVTVQVKPAVSCTPGEHNKGYSCTLTQTSSSEYKIECRTTATHSDDRNGHGECGTPGTPGGPWIGLEGNRACPTWSATSTATTAGGIGWRTSYAWGEYVLTTVGKNANHSSPAWTYKTCTAKFY